MRDKAEMFQTMDMKKLVLKMSFPIMISMLVQALYNSVDSMFVARLGVKQITALGLAYPVQLLTIALSNGIGIGMNSVVARSMGTGKEEEGKTAIGNAMILAMIVSVIFLIFGLFFTRGYLNFCIDDPQIAEYGSEYLSICCIFCIGTAFSVLGQRILQVHGLTTASMVSQLAGALMNLVLDPILIFGYFGLPAMGTEGAAIATAAGQIFSAAVAFLVYYHRFGKMPCNLRDLKTAPAMKEICKIGLPAALTMVTGSVMNFGMNWILKDTILEIAIFTIFYKLWNLLFMPLQGLMAGLIPIAGFNYGAKNKQRLYSSVKIGVITGMCIMAVGFLLFQCFPRELLLLFDSKEGDSILLKTGSRALRIISFTFVATGAGHVLSNVFQGMGDGKPGMLHAVLRQCLLLLPSAWILKNYVGESSVWYAFWIAEFAALLFVIGVLVRKWRKL